MKLKLKKETVLSIVSLGFILAGVLMIISFAGQGAWLEAIQLYLRTNYGFASLVVPFLFISAGMMLTQLKWSIAKPNVFLGGILVFAGVLGIGKGGIMGQNIFLNLSALILPIGASLVLAAVILAGIMVMTESSLAEWLSKFGKFSPKKAVTVGDLQKDKSKMPGILGEKKEMKIKGGQISDAVEPSEKNNMPEISKVTPSIVTDTPHNPLTNTPGMENQIYVPPSADLLDTKMGAPADRGDVKQNAHIIEQTLESFGIRAHVAEVNQGPAVTQYALEITLGTKLSRITTLQNDLALSLAAPTGQIRIEAPIPGRSMVGIEIPNRRPEMVSLRKMVTAPNLKKNRNKLAFGLGLNVSGEVVIADLTKMPHVLIAGATGSGKSVSVNAMIMQILFRASPEEVKFLMVDPKRVELTQYNGIPHLITPVIVEPDKVLNALQWAVNEMTNRYKMFAEVGVRNIEGYNQMSSFQALPYIVIIIDELADIMLFAPAKVEDAITRLAQMARAVGIHLVLATQRPSVDVLTGLIKANVPCRIAFNVTSMVDSRVIIDSPGAEKLIGRGDMLFIPPEQSKPSRIQGAFVSEEEVKRVLDVIKAQAPEVHYTEEVTSKSGPQMMGATGEMEDMDDLFNASMQIVVQNQKASASLFQRHLQVGYARAARILDQLEKAGIVGPGEGAKPRQILIKSIEEWKARQSSAK
jgi:S-DNA-T family DNA segregation ATPase FtsK/SpoIIIE